MRRLLAFAALQSLLFAQAAPELVVSVGHSGAPDHAAFFGNHLATATWSNLAIIDLTSGLTVNHLPQGSLVVGIEVNPAGNLMAVGTCGHAIQLLDTKSLTAVRRFALPEECPESLSFSPDGTLLATGASRLLARGSGIRHAIFGGDGRWVAGVDAKGKATIFGWPSGEELQSMDGLEAPGDSDSAAISSRDGRYFAWLGTGLRVWDVTSGKAVPLPGAHDVRDETAEFLDDGRLAYVHDDRLILRRLPDGPQKIVPLSAPRAKFYGDVGISEEQFWRRIRRDGSQLAGSRGPQTIIWDSGAARLREVTSPALMSPTSLQWSNTGIIAWADIDSGVRGWDDRSGKPADLAKGIVGAEGLAFRPDGSRLAVVGLSSMSVVDVASNRSIATRDVATVGAAVAFNPDGSQIAFTAASGALTLFDMDLHPRRIVATLDAHTSAEKIAFSRDGRWLAAGLGGAHPTLRVWPVAGSGSPTTLDTGDVTYGPQPPAFTGDSRWLASFRRGSSLTIWSTASWNVERTWTLSGTGRALAFAPDGSRLAVASDGEAAIWDPQAGRRLVTFVTPGSARMEEIAWSPDGRRVVTSADDGVLRFWNSSDGRLLLSLYMLDRSTDWLLVTPDGRLDGSQRALAGLVAWHAGNRIGLDRNLTKNRRVQGLWNSAAQP